MAHMTDGFFKNAMKKYVIYDRNVKVFFFGFFIFIRYTINPIKEERLIVMHALVNKKGTFTSQHSYRLLYLS